MGLSVLHSVIFSYNGSKVDFKKHSGEICTFKGRDHLFANSKISLNKWTFLFQKLETVLEKQPNVVYKQMIEKAKCGKAKQPSSRILRGFKDEKILLLDQQELEKFFKLVSLIKTRMVALSI